MILPVVVIGAGGHAKVLIDALRLRGVSVSRAVDADPQKHGLSILGVTVTGGDDDIFRLRPNEVCLVNGIGSVGLPERREEIYFKFGQRGYRFLGVVHPSAVVARDVVLAEGAQVMAGAVIQAGSRIGRNTVVNSRSCVDHDCIVGDHVHIAPGVTLSGGVRVADGVHIGTGATVIQGISIGKRSLVAAGALVIRDVAGNSTVMGVPARPL